MKSAKPVYYLNDEHGLHKNHVYSISVAKNQLVVGYQDGSIDILKSGILKHKEFSESSYNRVLSSFQSSELWLATDRGLLIANSNETSVAEHLRAIKCLSYRDRELLVGTYNGLYLFNLNTHESKKVFDQRTISVLAEGRDSIWIGTNNGLWLYSKGKVVQIHSINQLSGRIKGIANWSNEILAFGTHGEGLVLTKGEDFTIIDENDGLASDLCQALCADESGALWMGTNNGLFRLTIKENWHHPTIDYFNEENGLLSNYIEDLKVYDGKLYIATDEGISIFDLSAKRKSRGISTYIRKVKINNRDTALSKTFELDHQTNNIQIEFSAIAFASGQNTKFKHRLKGIDPNWIQSSIKMVNYEALPPGSYVFEVKAISSSGEVDDQGASISFVIRPPFWQELWFQLLLFCLIGLGVVLVARAIFKYNHRKDLEEKNKILEEKNQIIKESKQRSEDLLLNILPESVATELIEKGKVLAKDHEDVAVFFSDFKGFTSIAESMSPAELVHELDHCFRAFDQIMIKYRIEKLKTIGDAYMCATGLTPMNTDRLEDLIDAAIEVRNFMEEYQKERVFQGMPHFEIRIGIHTGHVVSGVVGLKKFAYDIWGDAVNIASRMESSGGVGKINTSRVVYDRVKELYVWEERGWISAKNKGEMEMFYILNRTQNVPLS